MKNGVQMINDHRPVDTYYNGVKIAGSETKTFSGTSLSIADTYNDSFSALTLSGRYQQDTPSVDNPVYPTFSGDCTLTVGNETLNIPILRAVLAEGGTIHADSYNVMTGEYVPKITVRVLDGTENFQYRNALGHYLTFWTTKWGSVNCVPYAILSSHFPLITYSAINNDLTQGISNTITRPIIKILDSVIGVDRYTNTEAECAVAFNSFLASEYANGTPVTLYQALATPTVTQLTPQSPKTMPYQTNITDNGSLPCNKTATLKVFGRITT